jgi:hypothetical protein
MNQTVRESSAAVPETAASVKDGQSFVLGLWGVRYQVKDVGRSASRWRASGV